MVTRKQLSLVLDHPPECVNTEVQLVRKLNSGYALANAQAFRTLNDLVKCVQRPGFVSLAYAAAG